MSRRAVVVLALTLFPVSLMAAQGRAAEVRHLVLDYEVYVGGFRTASIAYAARLGPSSYDLTVSLNGRGILDWWYAWKMRAFSHGKLHDGAIIPVRAGADSSWDGERRQTRLTYTPDAPPSVRFEPVRDEDDADRPAVRPALRKGARDLAGALFTLLSRIGASHRCDGRAAVFDGHRRYDLVLTHLGEDHLEPSSYSPYRGAALRCSLKIDRIAGYRRHPHPSRWRGDGSATVWLGRAFKGVPPVPVRLEFSTLLGALRGYLVRATLTTEGTVQRLALAP